MRDMFEELSRLLNYTEAKHELINSGLKNAIKRPHNLYTIKDDDGNVVLYRIEIVTTPFKKDDIKVRLSENNILTIQCGNENFHHEDEKYLTYRGISSQSYSFSLRLSNFIDCKNITAHNQDGILRIDMPVSMNESEPQEITIQ